MGSPLSPILGAIALIPLDHAMGAMKNIFYARYMDDWCVLTKTKTALKKVIKRTHEVINVLKFKLHPTKTYIGKISHGFNFLAYYMDHKKILPSKETVRRFFERTTALYEHSHGKPRRRHKNTAERDISEYHVNEEPPTENEFKSILKTVNKKGLHSPQRIAKMRQYIGSWAGWVTIGLGSQKERLLDCLQSELPSLYFYKDFLYQNTENPA